MSKYGVFSGLYFPVFGLNTEIYGANLRIQSKYLHGPYREKYRPENTPYLDTFHTIIPVFSPNRGTYGPEKTPYMDIFHGVNLRIQSKYRKYGPEKTHYLDTFHAVFGKCS